MIKTFDKRDVQTAPDDAFAVKWSCMPELTVS